MLVGASHSLRDTQSTKKHLCEQLHITTTATAREVRAGAAATKSSAEMPSSGP